MAQYDYSQNLKVIQVKCVLLKNRLITLAELAANYPIISIEDGMDENDWEGWKYLTEIIGETSTASWG